MGDKGGCYTKILYLINGIFFIFGAVMLGIAAYYFTQDEGIVIRTDYMWALQMLIAMGVLIIVISFLGLFGAKTAKSKIEHGDKNILLIIYAIIVFIILILQLAGAAALLAFNGVIQDSEQGHATKGVIEFERKLVENIHKELTAPNDPIDNIWADIEKNIECCGYVTSVVDLSHLVVGGDPWTPNDYDVAGCVGRPLSVPFAGTACKDLILDLAMDNIKAVGGVAIAFVFIELLGLVSACCLACCIEGKKGKGDVPHHR